MNTRQFIHTAKTMVASDKGLLAMDESNPARKERFSKWGFRNPRWRFGMAR